MPRNTTAKGEPSRRSRRQAGLSPGVAVDVGVRIGANDRLSQLPLEILTMILANLHPMELRRFSKTCKAFRKLVYDPKASRLTVWKPALEAIEDLPPCPPDLSEPMYVAWLYNRTDCQKCGIHCWTDEPKIRACFELRVSLCGSCQIKEFKTPDVLLDMGYDEKTFEFLPRYQVRGEFSYHLGTVVTLVAEYKKKRGDKAKQVWREEQERFWDNRMKHGLACRNARKLEAAKEEARQEEILEKFKTERIKTMKENLTKLGWEKEVERYFEKEPYELHTYTYKAMPLTDREWAGMLPKLTSLMETEREKLRKEEIEGYFEQRIDKWLKPTFTAFILSRPPNEINPNILDVALMDEWRTLLCTEPLNEDLTECDVEAASAKIPQFAETFRKGRIEKLLDVVRKSKTFSGQEVTEDVLQLASTVFRCTDVKCRPGEVNHYPHILAHSCNFLYMRGPSLQIAPRDAEHLPPPELPFFGHHDPSQNPIIRLYREEERHILTALKNVGIWEKLGIVFDDAAHEHMLSLLDALGWSHDTTVAEMEERQPYVECLCGCYYDPKKPRSRKIFRWKKAMYECKAHSNKKGNHQWFSKLGENDVRKSEEYEEVRHRSLNHQCPWCHHRFSWYIYDEHPRLCHHVSRCNGIQKPCPPEVQEHVKKVTVLAKEESWLYCEESVSLDGEQAGACQICRKIVAEEADRNTNVDQNSSSNSE